MRLNKTQISILAKRAYEKIYKSIIIKQKEYECGIQMSNEYQEYNNILIQVLELTTAIKDWEGERRKLVEEAYKIHPYKLYNYDSASVDYARNSYLNNKSSQVYPGPSIEDLEDEVILSTIDGDLNSDKLIDVLVDKFLPKDGN